MSDSHPQRPAVAARLRGAATPGRIVAAVLVAVALGTAVTLTVRYQPVLLGMVPSPDMRELHPDFDTFWHSAVAMLHGDDIYRTPAKLTNLNPPVLSVLLAPFALLGALPAYRLWIALTLLMIVGAVLAVARELRLGTFWTTAAVLALLLSSPLHGTLLLGQIYGLLLVAMAAGWIAERRGRPVLAAVLYGVAVAFKPSLAPILLLPFVQGRWRPGAAGIGGAAAATLVGVAVAGWSSGLEWLRIGLTTAVPDVGDNAALPGVAVRFGLSSTIGTAAGALLLVATLVVLGRSARRGAADPAGTAPWAVVAAGLLTAPIAWHNYLLLLWPGVLVLVALGREQPGREQPGRELRWSRPVAAVLLAVPVIPVSWGALWADGDPWSPVGRSLYCVVLLAYWVSLLVASSVPAASDRGAGTAADAPADEPERTAASG
ncbi:glycosyltransferase family 87 protein [Pseudonocardia sp. N23]|uniref:glycosyltransferase family 87 protein n=1 Tax=Pseudonocardia sp. N23 TaxID=1987376 RepID=UPI0011459CA4|nr:glycosyltransferase family 87 protein [Pseudonocardia sp. N23]